MLSPRRALCFLLVIPAFFIGCSNGSKPAAPTAPTAAASVGSSSIDLTTTTPPGTQGAGTEKPVVGTVSQVTGSCPATLTFVLQGVTVHVTGTTTFEGGACTDLQAGVRAGAIGTKNADGSIAAVRVKIAPPAPPAPPHASGRVSNLSGTCPALTFTLGDTTVHTSSATVFEGGTCADVKEGAGAGAVGPKDASGAIIADRVKIAPPPPPKPPHASGRVSNLSGTCPALTFTLGDTTVHTSSATVFDGRHVR